MIRQSRRDSRSEILLEPQVWRYRDSAAGALLTVVNFHMGCASLRTQSGSSFELRSSPCNCAADLK
jgi:hypothetical protein